LEYLIAKAESQNIKHTIFREPDIDNQITAVAFEPSDATKKLCKNLKLMLNHLK
jgi:hypothetical protein